MEVMKIVEVYFNIRELREEIRILKKYEQNHTKIHE
jgi:hypothetical protein